MAVASCARGDVRGRLPVNAPSAVSEIVILWRHVRRRRPVGGRDSLMRGDCWRDPIRFNPHLAALPGVASKGQHTSWTKAGEFFTAHHHRASYSRCTADGSAQSVHVHCAVVRVVSGTTTDALSVRLCANGNTEQTAYTAGKRKSTSA